MSQSTQARDGRVFPSSLGIPVYRSASSRQLIKSRRSETIINNITELLSCRVSPSGADRFLDELGASMAFPCGYVLARTQERLLLLDFATHLIVSENVTQGKTRPTEHNCALGVSQINDH